MALSRENALLLAEYNLLKLIRENGPVSQVKLSELSGYSRSTVSINCEKLMQSDLIVPDRDLTNSKKKNAELSINGNIGLVIGIGMGGTNCKIIVCNLTNEILIDRTLPIDLAIGPEPILESICITIDEMLERVRKENPLPLIGIGIGLPTPINYQKGVAYHPAFMPGWHLFPVKDFMNERYGCHIFVDNEVNAMALSEFEDYKDQYSVLLCVKVGTGIGAGIIIDGRIYRGENGGGGNIGHIQVDGNPTPCACGKNGCVEAIASAPAIIGKASSIASNLSEGFLHKKYVERKGKNEDLTLADIKESADHGDRNALELIKEAGLNLGLIVGKMLNFLDPGILIISGRLTVLGPNYLDYIRKAVYREASPWIGPDFQIVFSKYGDASAAKGAALLCTQELFTHNYIMQLKDLS